MKVTASLDSLRLRNLATAEPLHRIRAISLGGALEWLDHRDIAMFALGCLLDTWGLGGGDELMDKTTLARRIGERVCEQALDAEQTVSRSNARDYGMKVVEALLNNKEKGGEFTTRIYDRATRTFDTYAFHLVKESESDENRFYLEPSPHASNLYFVSFLVDVQDEIIAQQHALEHHLASGRTDKLATTADNHRRTASRLLIQVRMLSRKADRSIRTISPDTEVAPLLAEVRDAASLSSIFDYGIMAKLKESLGYAPDDAVSQIDKAIAAIKSARNFFLKARDEASAMLNRLEKAASQMACIPMRSNVSLPDLEQDIARPLMDVPLGHASVDEILAAFLGASVPQSLVVDPVCFLEAMMPPPMVQKNQDDEDTADDDFVIPPKLHPLHFGEKGVVAQDALEFLREHGIRCGSLGRLISHPLAKERGDSFAEALTLISLAAFKDQGGAGQDILRLPGMRLRSSPHPLPKHPAVQGSDLLIEATE